MFRESEIVACLQRILGENGSLRVQDLLEFSDLIEMYPRYLNIKIRCFLDEVGLSLTVFRPP